MFSFHEFVVLNLSLPFGWEWPRITTTRGEQRLTLEYRNCDEVQPWLARNKAAFRRLQNCPKLLGPNGALGAICSFGNWPAGWFIKLPQSSIFCRHIYIPSQFCKAHNFLPNVGTMSRQGQDMAAPRHLLWPSPLWLPLTICLRIRPFQYTYQPVKCHTKIWGLDQTRSSWWYWRRLKILRFSGVSGHSHFFLNIMVNVRNRFTWQDEHNGHHMLEQVHEMCEIERDKCSGCQFELER